MLEHEHRGRFNSLYFINKISGTFTLIGKYTDKNIKRSNKLVSVIRVVITAIYLLAKDKMIISINKTVGDNLEKVYETSIQNIIKQSKEDHDLLSVVGQMSLCFTEVIVLAVLSIMCIFIKKIFIILSILSTIFINVNIKNNKTIE